MFLNYALTFNSVARQFVAASSDSLTLFGEDFVLFSTDEGKFSKECAGSLY